MNVRLFAVARQLANRETIDLELPAGSTIAQLRSRLAAEVPELSSILPHVLFAIGSEYARDDQVLSVECQIACIPPVSGG